MQFLKPQLNLTPLNSKPFLESLVLVLLLYTGFKGFKLNSFGFEGLLGFRVTGLGSGFRV